METVLQISEAIAEREEGLEASARLRVMKQDEARFRRQLQEKRREKYEVNKASSVGSNTVCYFRAELGENG